MGIVWTLVFSELIWMLSILQAETVTSNDQGECLSTLARPILSIDQPTRRNLEKTYRKED